MLPRIFFAVVFLVVARFPAMAAEIELHRGDDGFDVITAEGDIKSGDSETFKRVVLQSKEGVVVLESDGGTLGEALKIGRAIQIAGLATYVPDNTICTSACALIWVAGRKRFLARSAQVGFHASYRDNDGQLEEVGVANAIVGRYLTLLNLPERSVIFATAASPSEILWIKTDGNDASGIEFEFIDVDDSPAQQSPPAAPSAPPTAISTQSNPYRIPQWYYVTESTSGSVFYVRGQDVENSNKGARSARFWVKTDDSGNKSVKYRSTMARYVLDCITETYKNEVFNLYDIAGKATELGPDYKTSPVVPDTVLASVVSLICTDDRPQPDERDIH